ncbi:MAG: hypothetical protein HKO91_01385 [Desulfobacterales bacterium]|nr:hypothetical protein [Desulfobacterales bacterium]
MRLRFLFLSIAILLALTGCEEKKSTSLDNFRNAINTEVGKDFVRFIEAHRESIKSVLMANNITQDTGSAIPKDKEKTDWLSYQVTALVKERKVESFTGSVLIFGKVKWGDTDIEVPETVSFYFKRLDNTWKLALRDGYFVPYIMDDEYTVTDLPPEIYADIKKIFPDQYEVNY